LNAREETHRRKIFTETYNEIQAFNALDKSYKQGINQFSDMTYEETIEYLGLGNISPPTNFTSSFDLTSRPTGKSLDWRNKDGKNYVGDVLNQGSCGSCWSFSTLGSLESIFYIRGVVSEMTLLSEQQLVSCWKKSCRGAWMGGALDFIRDNGIVSDKTYPYKGGDGNSRDCIATKKTDIVGKVSGHSGTSTEGQLEQAVTQVGPTSICVCVPKSFQRYKTGIYKDPECSPTDKCECQHAIVAVGYGDDGAGAYWIAKNSWGSGWGDKGYIKIARGINQCKIGNWGVYANL